MAGETVPLNKRVYLTMKPGDPGMLTLGLSYLPPKIGEAKVALISRGVLIDDMSIAMQIVSDPSANPALRGSKGEDGASAYLLARQQGYGGTLTAWLASLVGADGKSAYQLARDGGYGGTQTQWLATLIGPAGKDATDAQVAAAVASYMAAHPLSTLIGTATLSVTATAAIAVGVHDYAVPLAGVMPGDTLELTPTAALPTGWAIHGAVVTAAGTMRVTVTTPLLAINTKVSIDLKVRRLNL